MSRCTASPQPPSDSTVTIKARALGADAEGVAAESIQYRFDVWAWARLPFYGYARPRSRAWAMLRSGFVPMELTIGSETIVVRHPVLGTRLGRLFRLTYVLDTRDVVLTDQHPTFRPTLNAREAIVISGKRHGKRVDLAIAPLDRNLERLRAALTDVGVQSETPEPFA